MKLPSTIIVFGEKYSLKRKPGLQDEGLMGRCSPKCKAIEIDAELKGNELIWTVVHEICHAAFNESCANHGFSRDVEEIICDVIGKIIAENFNLEPKRKSPKKRL